MKSDTITEHLPEGWNISRISDLVGSAISGTWGDEPDNSCNVFPVIRSTDIEHDGNINFENIALRKIKENNLKRCTLEEGDILLVSSSGSSHLIGRASYFSQPETNKIYIFSNFMLRIRPTNLIDSKFLLFFLQSSVYKRFLRSFHETSTGLRNFPKSEFLNLIVPHPLLSEQQKISSILSKVDDLIQKTEEIIGQTQRLKEVLETKLIFKGIGHSSFKKVLFHFKFLEEQIPTDWNLMLLKDVSEDGLRNGIFKTSEYFGRGVPLVNVSDLFRETDVNVDGLERVQVNDKELETFGVRQGDIFFCRSSLVLDGIGRVNIVSHLPEPAVFECHLMMLRSNTTKIEPRFLAYYLRSHIARKFITSIAMTLTMTTIRQPDLEQLPVPVPPIQEQQQIVSILMSIDATIEKLRNCNIYQKNLKKGLMQKLLTGHIRVKM